MFDYLNTDAIYIKTDSNTVVVDININVCHIFNKTKREIIGKSILDFIDEDQKETFLDDYKNKATFIIDINIRNELSEVRMFEFTASITREKDFCWLGSEITLTKNIENKKIESYEDLTSLYGMIEEHKDPILCLDLNLNIMNSNKAFFYMTGSSKKEIISNNLSIYIYPEDIKLLRVELSKYDIVNLPVHIICKDKSLSKANIKLIKKNNKNREYIGYVCFIHDNSEHRDSKELIQNHEYYLTMLIKGMNIGLWDWNILTGDLIWSKELNDLIGIKEERSCLSYKEFLEKLHPDDLDIEKEALNNHIINHKPYKLEFRIKHNDGHYIWVYSYGQMISNNQGKPINMLGFITDVSSHKNIEQKMQEYLLASQNSNQELSEFSYIASHDLKEPLRGISNNARFLKEDQVDILNEQAIKRIDRIIYLSSRMESLTNDLLYFSRIGSQELDRKKTNINQIIEDVISKVDFLKETSDITFNVSNKLPEVICDPIKITEVFKCLITNAIKYNNKEKKTIEIGCKEFESNKDQNIFYVKDNGIGISEKYYNDIFVIFKRLNHESDDIKGNGTGLTFAKKIIEKHDGKIWLESNLELGTIFYFTIPEKNK